MFIEFDENTGIAKLDLKMLNLLLEILTWTVHNPGETSCKNDQTASENLHMHIENYIEVHYRCI